jgi:hypothetical protein
MAHLHGRALGIGIAVLALIGATSAYASASASSGPVGARAGDAAVAAASTKPPPPKSPPPTTPPPTTPPPSTEAATVCMSQGVVIPCNNPALGWWNSIDGCYWNQIIPKPPPADPRWAQVGAKPANGLLYNTSCLANPGIGLAFGYTGVEFDSQPPPGYGGSPGTTPQLDGLEAVLATNLLGPTVGIAPAPSSAANPNSTGLVGEPVWMWQKPTILTWGPLLPGGLTIPGVNLLGINLTPALVGIDALGAKIDWYMGDGPPGSGGTMVRCIGLGTPFPPLASAPPADTSPLLGALSALLNPLLPQPTPPPAPKGATVQPACSNQAGPANFRYSRPGTYTVTAAATWNVSWATGLTSGSISIVRYTPVQIKISELQVVVQ